MIEPENTAIGKDRRKARIIEDFKRFGNGGWRYSYNYVRAIFDVPEYIPNEQINKYILEKWEKE